MANERTNKGEDYPNISPSVMEADVQWGVELISNTVLTVSTTGGSIHIVDVSTERVYEVAGPLLTRLASGWVEDSELVRLTGNFQSTRLCVRSISQ